jgi:hypothetical protein
VVEAQHREAVEEVRGEEGRAYEAMVARRNVGLRIVVGVVAFDLLLLKVAVEAADRVDDQAGLTMAIRLIAVCALIVLAGMLTQIERRNRDDRLVYRNATERVRAIRRGSTPRPVGDLREGFWTTVSRSWATTWPLLGVLVLTIAIWSIAGLLTHPPATHEPGRSAAAQGPHSPSVSQR